MKLKSGDIVKYCGNKAIVLGSSRFTDQVLILRLDGGGWESEFEHKIERLHLEEQEMARQILYKSTKKYGWWVEKEQDLSKVGRVEVIDCCEITGNPMVIGEL